ncbi:MAG: hypothetical protein LBD90_08095, partial [Bifidobacteriaceae bacterium]|jgi:hypothetical protein|nr:hypothetical protein [Bifidobacteriaceae bacterium]
LALAGVALLAWGHQAFRVELPNYKADGVGYWTWQELVGFGGGVVCLVAAAISCVVVERQAGARSTSTSTPPNPQ